MNNEKKTILIVDDVVVNRKILDVILRDQYHILEAANGKEALDVCRREPGNISLIMLDIVMPVMDGFRFLEKLQRDLSKVEIPIIFVTTEANKENIVKGLKSGVSDIIVKPFDPQTVCERVARLLGEEEKRDV